EGDGVDVEGVSLEGGRVPAAGDFPQSDFPSPLGEFAAARGQGFAVAAEGHDIDHVGVPFENGEVLAAGDVPQLDRCGGGDRGGGVLRSGLNARGGGGPASRVATGLPVLTFQNLIVRSPPEATVLPSGLKATENTK